MPAGRPDIPMDLQRRLLVEAGHRCAIPGCGATEALEFAHIVPWRRVQVHEFENLIVLCANDHSRYDKNAIDRKAMLLYKSRLAGRDSAPGPAAAASTVFKSEPDPAAGAWGVAVRGTGDRRSVLNASGREIFVTVVEVEPVELTSIAQRITKLPGLVGSDEAIEINVHERYALSARALVLEWRFADEESWVVRRTRRELH